MQLIPSLRLPESLPNDAEIRSFEGNLHGYEPEFWEFEYQSYRYLESLSDTALTVRYKDIIRNMQALISRERDIIPIQSFLSSWYWFRKEHQTRLEFLLRKVVVPIKSPTDVVFNNVATGAPARPVKPNAGDILFRYDRQTHIEHIANYGSIRIRPASDFQDLENDRARQDDECRKRTFLSLAYVRVTTVAGVDVPVLGDVEKTVSMPDYYVFCMASDWDSNLFSEFDGADSCIVIKDVEEFVRRIKHSASDQLPNWYFHHSPVQYFDPYERGKNEYLNAGMSKDFRFAYQREYRFLWSPQNGEVVDGFKFLCLGSLRDLAEVYYRVPSKDNPLLP